MRLSRLITELSELLQRVDAVNWSETELGSYIHRTICSLSRRQAELDEGYFDTTIQLAASSARAVLADTWAYDLPQWVTKIVDMRENLSPTNPTGAQGGRILPPGHKHETLNFRLLPGVVQVRGFATALDWNCSVSKRPARLTKGTLPTQNLMDSTHLRIDTDTSANALIHPHETEPNSYINAIVEITGNTAQSGQFRRATVSSHFVDEGGTRYTVLTLDKAWTSQPLAGDTYELHMEIPEEHAQLVLLSAADLAWGARGNSDEQRALAPKIAKEEMEFVRAIQPRQTVMGRFMRHSPYPPAVATTSEDDLRNPKWV